MTYRCGNFRAYGPPQTLVLGWCVTRLRRWLGVHPEGMGERVHVGLHVEEHVDAQAHVALGELVVRGPPAPHDRPLQGSVVVPGLKVEPVSYVVETAGDVELYLLQYFPSFWVRQLS
eukprot:5432787-Pyramimonas_sp.AAC.1